MPWSLEFLVGAEPMSAAIALAEDREVMDG
jgi:hypothetical protein